MAENEKKAQQIECSAYEARDNEYLLMQGFKIFHVFFNRDLGSCSCKGFIVLRITIDKIRTIYEHKYNAMNLRLRRFSTRAL